MKTLKLLHLNLKTDNTNNLLMAIGQIECKTNSKLFLGFSPYVLKYRSIKMHKNGVELVLQVLPYPNTRHNADFATIFNFCDLDFMWI